VRLACCQPWSLGSILSILPAGMTLCPQHLQWAARHPRLPSRHPVSKLSRPGTCIRCCCARQGGETRADIVVQGEISRPGLSRLLSLNCRGVFFHVIEFQNCTAVMVEFSLTGRVLVLVGCGLAAITMMGSWAWGTRFRGMCPQG
jgi:hypothetical protein